MSVNDKLTRERSGLAPVLMALATIAALGVTSTAKADFIGYICDNAACSGGFVQVTDNGPGDNAPQAGILSFVANNIGGVTVTINTSQSKPLLGNGMDLSFVVTDADGGGGMVYLVAADTDFTGGATYRGSIGGTSDSGQVRASFCGGDSNVQFNDTPCETSSILQGTFAEQFGSLTTSADPYSLFLIVRVNVTRNGTTTGDFRVNVPEPATLALLGLGLLGIAGIRRRRKG